MGRGQVRAPARHLRPQRLARRRSLDTRGLGRPSRDPRRIPWTDRLLRGDCHRSGPRGTDRLRRIHEARGYDRACGRPRRHPLRGVAANRALRVRGMDSPLARAQDRALRLARGIPRARACPRERGRSGTASARDARRATRGSGATGESPRDRPHASRDALARRGRTRRDGRRLRRLSRGGSRTRRSARVSACAGGCSARRGCPPWTPASCMPRIARHNRGTPIGSSPRFPRETESVVPVP